MTPASRRLRIAHLALKGIPHGGGVERYVEQVGTRQARRGHRVVVYAMRHYGVTSGRYRGMHIRAWPTVPSRALEKPVLSALAAGWECLAAESDIVHLHSTGPGMFAPIVRALGRTTIVHIHGLEWMRSRWGAAVRAFLLRAEHAAVRGAHAVTAVSQALGDYLRRRYRMDAEVIPTGINPPEFAPAEWIAEHGLERGRFVLFLARLVREKAAHHLIEAYRRARPPWKLAIAGEATHEPRYHKELQDLAGGDENILFLGHVTGRPLRELLSHCGLFVLPSEVEGMSLALQEAMSYGRACLASDIPANRETLAGHGFTFRSGDVAHLAERLASLTAGEEDLEAAGRAAADYVLTHRTWDAVADRLEAFYHRVLAGRR